MTIFDYIHTNINLLSLKEFFVIFIIMLFGYLIYLLYALKKYIPILQSVIEHNISLGYPIKFRYAWKGVSVEPVLGGQPRPPKESPLHKDLHKESALESEN